jgi:hypothetical protein
VSRGCFDSPTVHSLLVADDGPQPLQPLGDLAFAAVSRLVTVDADQLVGRILLRHNAIGCGQRSWTLSAPDTGSGP